MWARGIKRVGRTEELAFRRAKSNEAAHGEVSRDEIVRGNREVLARGRGVVEREVRKARRSWGDGECIMNELIGLNVEE